MSKRPAVPGTEASLTRRIRNRMLTILGAALLWSGAGVGGNDDFGLARAQALGSVWMTDGELRTAFAGATIEGEYADGRTFREQYFDSGRLAYVEDARQREQKGHWSIVSGSFCTIYDLPLSGGCFRVRQHSANCYEFYFLTRTEKRARAPDPGQPSWTARAWRTGTPPTCRDKPMV